MNDLIHSAWGAAHTGAALAALVLGPVLFLRAKGGLSHRLLGYAYVAAMLVVCVAGWPIRSFGGLSPFHYLSIVSFVTVVLGAVFAFAAARLARTAKGRSGLVDGHLHWMGWSYIGLVAAGLSQLGGRLVAAGPDFGFPAWIPVVGASAVAVGLGALIVSWARPTLARRYFPAAR